MKVFLRKTIKVADKAFEKNSEGYIWVCLLHSDSFLVTFGGIRVEVARTDLDFPTK